MVEGIENLHTDNFDSIPEELDEEDVLFDETLGDLGINKESGIFKEQMGIMPGLKYRFTIKEGDTLGSIVKNSILNHYPELTEQDRQNWVLIKPIVELIKESNNIEDENQLKPGTKISVKKRKVSKIVDDYMSSGQYSGILAEAQNQGRAEVVKEEPKMVTLTSLDDFRNSEDPLVKRLYMDGCYDKKRKKEKDKKDFDRTKPGPRIYAAIESGQKVKIPKYMETENSTPMSLEAIIGVEPDEIIKGIDGKPALEGKTFVLDPGHGFNDMGAMGLARYGNESQKTQVTVFESAIMMDFAYRTAKLLKRHGANVEFTHYIPTRGICDIKDLPPCLPMNYEHEYRDKRKGQNGDKGAYIGDIKTESWGKRREISNGIEATMFISLHGNANVMEDGTKIEDGIIEAYYYHEGDGSDDFADFLMSENGIGEFIDGKHNKNYQHNCKQKGFSVIDNRNKNPSVLLEMLNLNNTTQAYQYRNPEIRQQKAEQLVNAIILGTKNLPKKK